MLTGECSVCYVEVTSVEVIVVSVAAVEVIVALCGWAWAVRLTVAVELTSVLASFGPSVWHVEAWSDTEALNWCADASVEGPDRVSCAC